MSCKDDNSIFACTIYIAWNSKPVPPTFQDTFVLNYFICIAIRISIHMGSTECLSIDNNLCPIQFNLFMIWYNNNYNEKKNNMTILCSKPAPGTCVASAHIQGANKH